MNFQETLALIEALKANGVTRFKSHNLEIDINPNFTVNLKKPDNKDSAPHSQTEVQATEKLKNLINTIHMSPEELANKIFPDGAL